MRRDLLAYAAALGPLALLVFALRAPPLRFFAPLSQRIFYFHVPLAVLAYAAFAVTLGASAVVLWRGRERADRLAHASAETGVLLAVLAVVTGVAWARVEFADYRPLADPKLVSVIVLALVYSGYLVLRSGIRDPPRRARSSAVFGIVAFLAVPAAYAASFHPSTVHPQPSSVESVRSLLLASLVLLAPLPAYLTRARYELLDLEARLAAREAA